MEYFRRSIRLISRRAYPGACSRVCPPHFKTESMNLFKQPLGCEFQAKRRNLAFVVYIWRGKFRVFARNYNYPKCGDFAIIIT